MWFNMPAPLVKWLGEVLMYEKTFVITDEYGEGGQVPADKFMIVTTSSSFPLLWVSKINFNC
jgi:putative NADPH-quinone reductase